MVLLDGHTGTQTKEWIAGTLTTCATPGSDGYGFWKGNMQ